VVRESDLPRGRLYRHNTGRVFPSFRRGLDKSKREGTVTRKKIKLTEMVTAAG
jgi:hypothetical protein